MALAFALVGSAFAPPRAAISRVAADRRIPLRLLMNARADTAVQGPNATARAVAVPETPAKAAVLETPAQLRAHIEVLQQQLDLANQALAKLNRANMQDEVGLLEVDLLFAAESVGDMGAQAAGETAAVADEAVPKPMAGESAADIVARAQAMTQAMMRASSAMQGLVEASEAVQASAPATESAADVVARSRDMMARAELAAAPTHHGPAGVVAPPPARLMPPQAVVQAQLEALQSGAAGRVFEWNSPSARRQCPDADMFAQMLKDTPEYQPLVGGERYEIRSVLATAERRWQCRVSVDGRDYRWQLARQQDEMLDVGTVVRHTQAGYVGVVVGWDDACRRSEEWCRLTGVDALPCGKAQPFYLVMLASERPDKAAGALEDLPTTYVPHELVEALSPRTPAEPGEPPLTLPPLLFTGAVDEAAGAWEATPFLRGVYPRGIEGRWLVDSVTPD